MHRLRIDTLGGFKLISFSLKPSRRRFKKSQYLNLIFEGFLLHEKFIADVKEK